MGHGSSTVVEEAGHVSVVDGGRGDTLPRFLRERHIERVETVIVSHADADHFGGISLLLSSEDFEVGQVFLNPDVRGTPLWGDFVAVMVAAQERGTAFHLELTNVNPGEVSSGTTRIEVLAPSQGLAVRTAGGRTADGEQLTPNAMSAVVRVWSGDSPRILVTGDIDQVGLDDLLANNSNIRADVLVFPHHGGRSGRSAPDAFAESIARAVGAKLVVFSIGRGRYGTPRPEIVAGVLRVTDGAHIACTQLSEHCATELPTTAPDLHTAFSRGAASRACCSGTLEVLLEPDDYDYFPSRSTHLDFILQNAPTALCRRYAGRGSA